MNAAARALTQGIVMTGLPAALKFRRLQLSVQGMLILSLILALLISAVGIITLCDKNRIAIGNYANLQQARSHLQTRYGQLLLEENTWSTPARIATIAQQQLGMTQPTPQQVVIVNT